MLGLLRCEGGVLLLKGPGIRHVQDFRLLGIGALSVNVCAAWILNCRLQSADAVSLMKML